MAAGTTENGGDRARASMGNEKANEEGSGGRGKISARGGGADEDEVEGGGLVLIPGVAAAWGGEPVGRRPQARALGRPHSEDDAGGGAGRLGSARWAEAQGGGRGGQLGQSAQLRGGGLFLFLLL